MTRDHTLIEELMAADALGGLDADDRALLERERAAHGVRCAECEALEAGFAETAGRLAFALTPEPIDDGIVDRILAASPAGVPERVIRVPESERDREPSAPARRPRRMWRALAAAAAVVAIAAVAVGALVPRSTEVQATSAQRLVAFSGDTEGTLAMAFTPGEPGAVFWGSGHELPPDQVLEVWMIDGDEVVSGGCVIPTDGAVAFRVDAEIGETDTMAVTVEPSDCPPAPTSQPVLTADLTTVV